MDTDKILAQSRARFDHAQTRLSLKEKYQAKLVFAQDGGMWQATPEMISFLNLYENQEIVVLDLYDTPIKVRASALCDAMKLRWQEQMTAWEIEFNQISQVR